MIKINNLADIIALKESVDLECKLASGKNGQGILPKEFWLTYSAFANTQGGEVFLGLREKQNHVFEVFGIVNTQKVLDELWTSLNNRNKVSANLLREEDVRVIELDGKNIIHIHVPRSPRKTRPIYLKGNPLIGTYKRLHSSDCLCDEETVRRMLAEQVEDSRDEALLENYTLDDLDRNSLKAYRQMFANRQPEHPWNSLEDKEFLRMLGAWRIDRYSNKQGLSRAGLLMFGQLVSIQEIFPNYMLDYQERFDNTIRWTDRITIDGMWSGNIFDFYRKTILKLIDQIKVPFVLEKDIRQDDTVIHQALREALVNTLVHADYTGRSSVLVVKYTDRFYFRNPGLMRIPLEIAIQGGESDCRNSYLHKMFRLIGLGEQAGSGIPKIYTGWQSQHKRMPVIEEQYELEQTIMTLYV